MFVTPALRADALIQRPPLPLLPETDLFPVFIESQATLPLHDLTPGHPYRVVSGCLSLYRQIDSERRQILDVLAPGRILDRVIVERLFCRIYAFAPTCLEPVTELPLHLASLVAEHRELMLDRAVGQLVRLGRMSAGERVAEALLDLANQYGGGGGSSGIVESFPFHLGRGDLADWLGLTLETVSRCMSRLKQDGLVTFGKEPSMAILDPEGLRAVARGTRKLPSLYAPRHPR